MFRRIFRAFPWGSSRRTAALWFSSGEQWNFRGALGGCGVISIVILMFFGTGRAFILFNGTLSFRPGGSRSLSRSSSQGRRLVRRPQQRQRFLAKTQQACLVHIKNARLHGRKLLAPQLGSAVIFHQQIPIRHHILRRDFTCEIQPRTPPLKQTRQSGKEDKGTDKSAQSPSAIMRTPALQKNGQQFPAVQCGRTFAFYHNLFLKMTESLRAV